MNAKADYVVRSTAAMGYPLYWSGTLSTCGITTISTVRDRAEAARMDRGQADQAARDLGGKWWVERVA